MVSTGPIDHGPNLLQFAKQHGTATGYQSAVNTLQYMTLPHVPYSSGFARIPELQESQ